MTWLRYAGDTSFAMTSVQHRGRPDGVAWDFRVRPDVGWGGRFGEARRTRRRAARGARAALSPHYQVLMSLGHATGWVEIEGQRRRSSTAALRGKNWGRGFPRKRWWLSATPLMTWSRRRS